MYATRIWPGKKMGGRMGGERQTCMSIKILKIDPKHNLLFLAGSVPGNAGGHVRIKDAERVYMVSGAKRRKGPLEGVVEPPFPTFLPGDPGDDDESELLAPDDRKKDPLNP